MTRLVRRSTLAVLMVAALLVGLLAATPAFGAVSLPPCPVEMQMVVCLDASSSIDPATWAYMKAGLVKAINDVLPKDGSVELGVNKFGFFHGGVGKATVVVPMTVVNASTAPAIAAQVAAELQIFGWTPTSRAIDLAVAMMQGSSNWECAKRHVINIVTDGYPAQWPPGSIGREKAKKAAIDARNAAIRAGVTELHAELVPAWKTGVIPGDIVDWWKVEMVYPEPGMVAPPYDPVNCGFVAKAFNADQIAEAIKGKLCGTLELTPEEARNPYNTDHTVTATLKDALGNPIPGAEIKFEVTGGPNKGAKGTAVTDKDGKASWTYTDMAGEEGTDTIQATYGCASDTASKTWFKQEEPPPVPSVTGWGLIATVLALAASGLLLLRRQARVNG